MAEPRHKLLGRSIKHAIHAGGYRSDRLFSRSVGRWDWRTGRADSFDFGAGQLVEEFIPADPDLIRTTLTLDAGVSELHLPDSQRASDGAFTSWRIEVAVPLSFHGSWYKG